MGGKARSGDENGMGGTARMLTDAEQAGRHRNDSGRAAWIRYQQSQAMHAIHRQLARVVADLSDAAGIFLVRAVHHETRGWQWVSEPL